MGLVRKRDMMKKARPGQEQQEPSVRVSRTQKKKEALSLQELGERLVRLSDKQLKKIDLPENVLDAVKAAQAITKHTPRDRQLQYIGALMRKCDPVPIREFLDALEQGGRKQAGNSD